KNFPENKSEAEMGLDKPEAVVSIWADGIAKEEKDDKDKKDKDDKDKKDAEKDKDKKSEEKDKKDSDSAKDKKDEKKDDKPKTTAKPKLKSDTPQVELTFGKRESYRDQKIVYVKRKSGGETTVVTVPEVVLEKVTAGPLGYLDKKLPGFTTEF